MSEEERIQRIVAFLRDYMALCKKHNIIVDACGCCNSPYLVGNDVGAWSDRPDETEKVCVDSIVAHLVNETWDASGGESASREVRSRMLAALGLEKDYEAL